MRSMIAAAALAGLTLFAAVAPASAEGITITKPSAHSVTATLDRLQKVLESKGITIFTRIDHAAGAKKVGQDLPPTQLLVFGNPKLGTPLMQSNRAIGLDLPMKALAWQDADGKVFLTYTAPSALKDRHKIGSRDKVFGTMTKALDAFTTAATKAE